MPSDRELGAAKEALREKFPGWNMDEIVEIALSAAATARPDEGFTLDQIHRALRLYFYGESRAQPGDDDDTADSDRQADEMFEQFESDLFYCRSDPDAFGESQ